MIIQNKKKTYRKRRNIQRYLQRQLAHPSIQVYVSESTFHNDPEEDVFQRAIATLQNLSVQPAPVSVSLRNVSYKVKVQASGSRQSKLPCAGGSTTEDKYLLNNINAFFLPGTMTALMGSSGAGKTTLMDVIAGRKTSGQVYGDIMVNGHPQDLHTFARVSGYVEQTDIHVPTETVMEALRFSALHRLPREMPKSEKEAVIDAVIDLIELRPILAKVIGVPVSEGGHTGLGLSVEQRKRVTIAVEMVANPSVLFLDEPTSGLDSRSARIVMRSIRRIAASGRTVLCTIHQPSFEMFSAFDNLLLLKKGGHIVYNGALGPSRQSELTGEEYNSAQV
jgi:ABC-type multidrug transport system ATPase subunit